ncbi:MAG TPA: hypothetical protein VFE58_02165 [Tepidisphaeraceae bacterium]|jgi:uncharacterized DUF497 family protein|nr:hypothetical protein [Tepidisphaeraceae bacterium]
MEFRWIDWNIQKCLKHGVDPSEVEFVVRRARRPYPRKIEDEKTLVCGQTDVGRYLQVIYLIDEDDAIFIIHAMPLTPRKKRNYRRSRK